MFRTGVEPTPPKRHQPGDRIPAQRVRPRHLIAAGNPEACEYGASGPGRGTCQGVAPRSLWCKAGDDPFR